MAPGRWAAVVAVIGAAACASTARRGDDLGPPAAAAMQVAAESIVWTAERRLTWDDFRGRPDITSGAGAMTVYLLSYDGTCLGETFDSRVFSAFLPDQSWVKTAVLLAPAHVSQQALAHEQTHFDLSEVSARRMRRAIAALKQPCSMSDEQLNAVVDPFLRGDFERQRRYDRDTGYGSVSTWQRDWDVRVGRELTELGAYVR
jgi:hypothetical protein